MLFTTEILKIYKLVNSVTKTQYREKTLEVIIKSFTIVPPSKVLKKKCFHLM